MHRTGDTDLIAVDFDNPQRLRHPYDDSKLQVTALAMAIARIRQETLSHAVDPGWVPTRMGGASASDDLDKGHRTQEWLVTADAGRIDPRTGGYWYHRRAGSPHPAALDADFQDALLGKLRAHTGIVLPERAASE